MATAQADRLTQQIGKQLADQAERWSIEDMDEFGQMAAWQVWRHGSNKKLNQAATKVIYAFSAFAAALLEADDHPGAAEERLSKDVQRALMRVVQASQEV